MKMAAYGGYRDTKQLKRTDFNILNMGEGRWIVTLCWDGLYQEWCDDADLIERVNGYHATPADLMKLYRLCKYGD